MQPWAHSAMSRMLGSQSEVQYKFQLVLACAAVRSSPVTPASLSPELLQKEFTGAVGFQAKVVFSRLWIAIFALVNQFPS